MKGAQSFGISNTNCVTSIANVLYKISLDEIKIPVKLNKVNINRSKRSRDATEDDAAIENVSEDETDDSNRPSRGNQKFRIRSTMFNELIKAMKNSINVFWQRTEDHPLEACYDALTTSYFLANINPNFADSIDDLLSTLVDVGSSSRRTMTLFYRSLMPALTLAQRDQRFPENTRSKNQIHKASVLLVSELFKGLVELDRLDNFAAEEIEDAVVPTNPLPFPAICILGAMQRMTVAVVDKAPTRATALTSLCHLVERIYDSKMLATETINHYLVFLSKLSKCNKVSHRAYSLEIATSIMSFDWIWDIVPSSSENVSPHDSASDQMPLSPNSIQDLRKNEVVIGPKTLILILVGRCDDAAPTVRTRAISAVSDLLENLTASTPKLMAEFLLQLILGVDSINLLDILRTRTYDDKPLVRTKALSAYGAALCKLWPKATYDQDTGLQATEFISLYLTEEDVNVFMECCNDTSISVRKQAISSLTNLVNCRKNENLLQEAWVVSVLPLVADGESTVQAKFAQCAYDILINSVLAWDEENKSTKKSTNTSSDSDSLAWSMCVRTVTSGRSKLLKSCIILMARIGLFANSGKNSLKNLLRIIKYACVYSIDTEAATDNIVTRGAWALLEGFIDIPSNIVLSDNSTLSTFGSDIGSVDFVTKCYKNKKATRKSSVIDDEELRILRVMDKVVPNMDIHEIKYVKTEVLKLLLGMRCEPSAISVLTTIMFSISKRLNNEDDSNGGWRDVQDWSCKLLVNAYNILYYKVWLSKPSTLLYGTDSSVLTGSMEADINSSIDNGLNPLLTALFTVGEVSMMGFSVEDDEINSKKYDNTEGNVPSYTVSTVSKVFKLNIPDAITKLVQLLMSKELPTIDGAVRGNQEVIRAYAFLTVGKLCLREKSKARELINVFLREIQNVSESTPGSAAVRSNALLVLGDICVRYTSLVEHHVGAMASCLQDPDVLVRRHALVLLTQLLLQDFLKWRGMLLYRFLATAVDQDSDMTNFAKSILTTTLHNKYPDLFVQHFTEAVIIFNNYMNHPAYLAAASNGSDGDESSCAVTMEGVNLEGSSNISKRFFVYNMMMEDLTDEQKLTISAKLVQDILSNAVDYLHSNNSAEKNLASNQAFEDVLQDTLLLLKSPLLKLDSNRSGVDGSDVSCDDDNVVYDINPDEHNNAIAKAKTKVLVKISKQHLISHILPIIMSLKSGLESSRSSLQRSIMEYLVHIMKNNKNEITQALYNDPALKAEIEYDLKMYEKIKLEKSIKIPFENDENVLSIDVSDSNKSGRDSVPSSANKTPSKNKNSACPSPAPAVLKSVLKENNGGSRTPKDSLKCIMKKDKSDKDLTDRYLSTFSQPEIDSNIPKKDSKTRRSWTVVVEGLDDNDENEENDDDVFSPDKKRITKTISK